VQQESAAERGGGGRGRKEVETHFLDRGFEREFRRRFAKWKGKVEGGAGSGATCTHLSGATWLDVDP